MPSPTTLAHRNARRAAALALALAGPACAAQSSAVLSIQPEAVLAGESGLPVAR